jgi:hypothetical protein
MYVHEIFYTTLYANKINVEILRQTVACGAYCLLTAYVLAAGRLLFQAFYLFFLCFTTVDDLRIENLVLNIDKKLYVYTLNIKLSPIFG